MRGEAAPERLISIARVFESQGHFKHADSMYREALTRNPSCKTARDGIAQIAKLNQIRPFDTEPPSDARQKNVLSKTEGGQTDTSPEALTSAPIMPSFAPGPGIDVTTSKTSVLQHGTLARNPSCEATRNDIAQIAELNQIRPFDAEPPSDARQKNALSGTEGGQTDISPEAQDPASTMPSFASAPDIDVTTSKISVLHHGTLAFDHFRKTARQGIPHIADLNQTHLFGEAGRSATGQQNLSPETESRQTVDDPEAQDPAPAIPSFTRVADTGVATFEMPTPKMSQNETPVPDALPLDTGAAVVLKVKTVTVAGSNSLENKVSPESTVKHNESIGVAYLPPEDPLTQLTSATVLDVGDLTTQNLTADRLDAPGLQVDSLLTTLRCSNSPEQRALAATLLADTPGSNTRVNSALEKHCTGKEAVVATAAVESLFLRGFTSKSSVHAVLVLAEHPDFQIRRQVCSCMRLLAGTPWEFDAIKMLTCRLDDSHPAVRGMAALTLGDFDGKSDVILERLIDRYSLETDSGVRNSLELTAERLGTLPVSEDTAESVGS